MVLIFGISTETYTINQPLSLPKDAEKLIKIENTSKDILKIYKNNKNLISNELLIDLSLMYYKQKEEDYEDIFSSIYLNT